MSRGPTPLTPDLYEYLLNVSLREHPLLKRLRDETARHPRAGMQISPEQGQFMQLLIKLLHAKKTIEVGVFTGYSSLAVALALPADGRIVACDVSEEYTSVARRYWQEAGVASRIDLRLAPAAETLSALIKGGESGTYDFAFIDADKSGYDTYYEHCLTLLRPGGIIGIDNVLWNGRVVDPAANDEDTVAIRALNKKLQADTRIDLSMLSLGDGLTLAHKR